MFIVNISLLLIKAWIFSFTALIMLTSIMLILHLPKYLMFRANEHLKFADILSFSDCRVLDIHKVEYLTVQVYKDTKSLNFYNEDRVHGVIRLVELNTICCFAR